MYWHEATFSCPFLSWQFKIPSKIKHFTSIIHQKNQNFIKYKMSPFWVLIHRFNPRIHILFAAFIDLYSRHFLHLFNFISSKSNGITLKRPPSMGLNKKKYQNSPRWTISQPKWFHTQNLRKKQQLQSFRRRCHSVKSKSRYCEF